MSTKPRHQTATPNRDTKPLNPQGKACALLIWSSPTAKRVFHCTKGTWSDFGVPVPVYKWILSISSVRTLFEQIQLISRKGLNIIGDGFVK